MRGAWAIRAVTWVGWLTLLVMAAAVPARAQSSDPPEANPARPTVATPATLTPVGYLQFETGGFAARHSPEFDSQFNLNEVVKLTVHPRLELLAVLEPFARSKVGGSVTNGGGDVSLGFQAVLHPGEGARPTIAAGYFGHVHDAGIPGVDFGGPLNSVLLLASADVHGFHYDTNAWFNDLRDSGVDRLQLGQTISIAHPLGRGFGLGGELWHFTQPFLHGNCAGNLWAVSYNARKNLVLDVGFNRGLTSTSTRWEVVGGFTYLLPHKLWR